MKEIVIIAGPNGSGKSTLAGQLEIPGQIINADLYDKELFPNITDKDEKDRRIAIVVAQTIKDRIKEGKSFAFETVFSAEHIPQFLQKAKSQGYVVTTHFIATDNPLTNVARVAKRVAEGGHDVPKQKILDRYGKSLKILPKLFEFSDRAIIYDNSQNTIRPFLVKEDNQIKVLSDIPNWANGIV